MAAQSENKANRGLYWIIFLVSTVICIYMMLFISEWFWLTLPFVFTYLAKALDVM